MSVILNPYLLFSGNAVEVLDFYKSVFGGEVDITHFSDFPDMEVPEDQKGMVMHSVLKNDHLQLMVSDATPSGGAKNGENISLSLSGDDLETLTNYFEGLSAGGKVTQPLAQHPWGDTFGMLIDKFGISWMFNITATKS